MNLRTGSVVGKIPPPLFIVASGLIQYVGAAIAVLLFDRIAPASLAWCRVVIAALILLVWRRPWREGLTRRDLWFSALFGVVLTSMNTCFYQAIAVLPLGSAVSIEFLGPVAVALVRGRGWMPRLAAIFALAGVVSIGGLGVDLTQESQRVGVAWILGAAASWALYIVLGQKIAATRSGVTNLALGCAAGGLIFSPALGSDAVPALGDWRLFGAVVLVAVLSTAVPYSLEAIAMSRVPASTFALLTALLPATSTLSGILVLHQVPSVGDVVGMLLVSVAVWIVSGSTSRT